MPAKPAQDPVAIVEEFRAEKVAQYKRLGIEIKILGDLLRTLKGIEESNRAVPPA